MPVTNYSDWLFGNHNLGQQRKIMKFQVACLGQELLESSLEKHSYSN